MFVQGPTSPWALRYVSTPSNRGPRAVWAPDFLLALPASTSRQELGEGKACGGTMVHLELGCRYSRHFQGVLLKTGSILGSHHQSRLGYERHALVPEHSMGM